MTRTRDTVLPGNALIWQGLGVAVLILVLAWLIRGTSIEDQYPGKRVLRVEFSADTPEITAAWETIKTAFEAAHPEVVVLRVAVDANPGKLMTMTAAGRLPDILSPNTFTMYSRRLTMLPLNALIAGDLAELQPEDFDPEVWASCSYDNEQLIIPYFFNVSLLYYNIDMFKAAGVDLPDSDWLWADYVEAARRIREHYVAAGDTEKWGTAIVPGWWVEWLAHIHQAGGQLIGDDWLHSAVDSPEAVAGLRFYHDLVHTYKIAPEPRDMVSNPFLNQQTAMEFAGHTNNWVGLRSHATFAWDIATLPRHESGTHGGERVSIGFGINRDSKHRDLAWSFIKHFCSRKSMETLTEAGWIPVRKSVADTFFFKRDADGNYVVGPPHKEVAYEALRHCREQSSLPEFASLAFYQAQPFIDAMMLADGPDKISPEQCAAKISEKVTRAMLMENRRNPEYDYR